MHTHDYAHVHAIVKMQLKFSIHALKSTCEQPHANRMHVHMHTYMHTSICVLSLSLPYACSLQSCHFYKDLSSS